MQNLTDEQGDIVEAGCARKHLVVEAGAGCGKSATARALAKALAGTNILNTAFNKALRDDQPVLTPTGWRPIASLSVGDLIVGRDGKPHAVTTVRSCGVRPLYEVLFSDRTTVIADEGHPWVTQTITYDARNNAWRVRTTQEIAATVHQKHRVPHLASPVEMPEADLPLHPYLLGALIGDGSLCNGNIRFTCVEPELVELMRSTLPAGHELVSREEGAREWGIVSSLRGRGRNEVLNAIRALGLHGHGCSTKFVPTDYLFASASQRLALLQGLMDTDGCASGPRSIFVTTSKQLAEDVTFLSQSLGGVASIRHVPGDKNFDAYYVNVRLAVSLCPFRLSRKISGWRPRTRDQQTPRKIIEARTVTPAKATCIGIDADNHLFLAAGCIPTG
ncbi:LAGLIDADG family homing endonuclease [Nonomuraea sp. CA-143628]|uniref:LAGLIDADG family homing endonuclease n=1 Tax=Nonomuraea sp. CA-143628 TaxID=3239997 RepID=UPI003D912AF7